MKFWWMEDKNIEGQVTTLAVVWIEIFVLWNDLAFGFVTTLAVVWIEILKDQHDVDDRLVTTLAVVWIEIEI